MAEGISGRSLIDGGFADESGEEYEDVRENLRSVGFGKNPKGDRSFLCFIQLWIY